MICQLTVCLDFNIIVGLVAAFKYAMASQSDMTNLINEYLAVQVSLKFNGLP